MNNLDKKSDNASATQQLDSQVNYLHLQYPWKSKKEIFNLLEKEGSVTEKVVKALDPHPRQRIY